MMTFSPIASDKSTVYFNAEGYTVLNKYISEEKPSLIVILVDSNTLEFCLPNFLPLLETDITIETIEIEAGEQHKTIETCNGVWNALSEIGADRKSLIINLGGGVVTDLGGFVASTYKRGITYINIPTSLLAMVDASIGGKTGVDLGSLKNQVGVISQSKMVLIDTSYLNTLPGIELRSGHAEILKHGLIANEAYYNESISLENLTLEHYDELIYKSVEIKNNIVLQDPTEENLRKTLNFGHTLGHAIESFLLEHPSKEAILHGDAVAIGMILALYLSTELYEFPKEKSLSISKQIKNIYGTLSFSDDDITNIEGLLKFDKKNSHGNINFVLLENIAKPVFNCQVESSTIHEAFKFYENL